MIIGRRSMKNKQGPHEERQKHCILLAKITAAQNEVALSYHSVRGPYSVCTIFSGSYFAAIIP